MATVEWLLLTWNAQNERIIDCSDSQVMLILTIEQLHPNQRSFVCTTPNLRPVKKYMR